MKVGAKKERKFVLYTMIQSNGRERGTFTRDRLIGLQLRGNFVRASGSMKAVAQSSIDALWFRRLWHQHGYRSESVCGRTSMKLKELNKRVSLISSSALWAPCPICWFCFYGTLIIHFRGKQVWWMILIRPSLPEFPEGGNKTEGKMKSYYYSFLN